MSHVAMEFESLALVAGGMIAAATVPQILLNLNDPVAAAKQSVTRNLMIATGSAIWVFYGLQNNLFAVPLFCGINGGLVSTLVVQQVWRKAFPKPQ